MPSKMRPSAFQATFLNLPAFVTVGFPSRTPKLASFVAPERRPSKQSSPLLLLGDLLVDELDFGPVLLVDVLMALLEFRDQLLSADVHLRNLVDDAFEFLARHNRRDLHCLDSCHVLSFPVYLTMH